MENVRELMQCAMVSMRLNIQMHTRSQNTVRLLPECRYFVNPLLHWTTETLEFCSLWWFWFFVAENRLIQDFQFQMAINNYKTDALRGLASAGELRSGIDAGFRMMRLKQKLMTPALCFMCSARLGPFDKGTFWALFEVFWNEMYPLF